MQRNGFTHVLPVAVRDEHGIQRDDVIKAQRTAGEREQDQ